MLEEMDPDLYAEDSWKVDEANAWEMLSYEIWRLIGKVQENRMDYEQLTHAVETPEYDEVEARLTELQEYADGRAQELNPDYVELKYEYKYRSKLDREMVRYATQEGINCFALESIHPIERRKSVIEYLSEHGLASMSYDATKRAIKEVAIEWR